MRFVDCLHESDERFGVPVLSFANQAAAIDLIACRMRTVTYSCAFCGEDNDVLVDPSGGPRQTFTEDCAVCCRPNLITLAFGDDGTVRLDAVQEYEA